MLNFVVEHGCSIFYCVGYALYEWRLQNVHRTWMRHCCNWWLRPQLGSSTPVSTLGLHGTRCHRPLQRRLGPRAHPLAPHVHKHPIGQPLGWNSPFLHRRPNKGAKLCLVKTPRLAKSGFPFLRYFPSKLLCPFRPISVLRRKPFHRKDLLPSPTLDSGSQMGTIRDFPAINCHRYLLHLLFYDRPHEPQH